MAQVTLRKQNPADIAYYSVWWHDKDLIAVTSGDFTPLTQEVIDTYFTDMINAKNQAHYMIECDDETIGDITLVEKSDALHELQIIIGNHAYQNKGYGTQAIEQILAIAKTNGAKQVELFVRPDNARAIRVYQKTGFTQVGDVIETHNPLKPQLLRMVTDL